MKENKPTLTSYGKYKAKTVHNYEVDSGITGTGFDSSSHYAAQHRVCTWNTRVCGRSESTSFRYRFLDKPSDHRSFTQLS